MRLVALLAGSALLSGCLGDPAPDPATAPLEVVMDACELNRDQVAPGTHAVSIVGVGQLVVTDESGVEVLVRDSDGQGAGTLVTTEQTYTFRCIVDDGGGEVALHSHP